MLINVIPKQMMSNNYKEFNLWPINYGSRSPTFLFKKSMVLFFLWPLDLRRLLFKDLFEVKKIQK